MYLSTTWLQLLSVVKVTNFIVRLLLVVAPSVCGDLCSVLIFMCSICVPSSSCTDPEVGRGLDPLKNHKNIRFFSNVGSNPRKSRKLPSKHSLLGHHRHASETPFKWS